MRLASCLHQGQPKVLLRSGNVYRDLRAADPGIPASIHQILQGGSGMLERVRAVQGAPQVDPENVQYLPPITDPQKILCVGLNYVDHARETGAAIPAEPVIFNKLTTALCGHGAPILLPRESSQVDYEAELVVVIGMSGRRIPLERARAHVAGYTCGHDVSARDWQKDKPQRQWLLGKSFDTFAPLGPELVTADEVADPENLSISLRRNGQLLQQSSTRQFIFGVDQLIAYISQVCTLHPGDLIFTGTPPGVGVARQPPAFLQDGDEVEVEIESVGTLRNLVVGD